MDMQTLPLERGTKVVLHTSLEDMNHSLTKLLSLHVSAEV